MNPPVFYYYTVSFAHFINVFRNQATKHELCPKPDHSLARRFTVNEKLDSCCGDSVYKFPFASAGGKRACCGTRTYDTDIMQCCDQDRFYLLREHDIEQVPS